MWYDYKIDMSDDLIEQIKAYLKSYEESIEELDKNFDKIELHGRYQAGVPLRYKHEIYFLIEYLEKKGADTLYIKNQFNKINKTLEVFEQEKRKAYWDKVYKELKELVDTYPVRIEAFLKLDPIDIETGHNIYERDMIDILLNELQKDYDVRKMKSQVSKLDAALKRKFIENMDELLKECPNIEEEYYPESFWWRHPSKLRSVNK